MSTLSAQTRAAQHDRAVVFACDARQLPVAMFAAERIRRTEPSGRFDIVIAMPEITDVPPEMAARPDLRFCQIDVSSLPDRPMFREWISFATYFRWVLPAALRQDYKTLFYLDTDTYLRRPGIDRLFDSLDAPVALSAVVDFQRFAVYDRKREDFVARKLRDMGGKEGQYYNAGVLLIQPEPFIAMDGFGMLVDGIRRNEAFDPIYEEQDQGAMNLAFADVIAPMNPLYNWCSRDWLNAHMVEMFDPIVLHFAGPNKPWNDHDDPYIAQFRDEYMTYLETAFPDFAGGISSNSAASRYAEAKYRVSLFNDIRVWLYRRRWQKKLERAHSNREAKAERMRHAITEAEVGA